MPKETKTRPPTVERRFIPLETAELRVTPEEAGLGKTEGYIARYNVWSPVYFDFRERIAPGFFDEAIGRDDIRHLRDHKSSMILGRNKAGTVTYRSDDKGLWHESPLPDTTYARDLAVSMDRGDVTGASFAFSLPEDGSGDTWEKGTDGVMERTLVRAAKIFDTSIVTFPWYEVDTEIAHRSLDAWRSEHDGASGDEEAEEVGSDDSETDEVAEPEETAIEDLRRRLQLGR